MSIVTELVRLRMTMRFVAASRYGHVRFERRGDLRRGLRRAADEIDSRNAAILIGEHELRRLPTGALRLAVDVDGETIGNGFGLAAVD